MSNSVADAYAEWLGGEKPFAWSSDTPPTKFGPREVGKSPTHVHAVQYAATRDTPVSELPPVPKEKVGIVGAGMSGLYAGLLLKEQNIPFHIFEGSQKRLGGRVYTCRDGFIHAGSYQYFEAGAMRIPCTKWQDPLFELINYLNHADAVTPEDIEKPHLTLIDYNFKHDGNLVYVNGNKMTLKDANKDPQSLGFCKLNPDDQKKTADSLMDEAMKPLLEKFDKIRGSSDDLNSPEMKEFFETYDTMSMRYYLETYEHGPQWYPAKVDYVETMTEGTNSFAYSLVESFIEYQDFNKPSDSDAKKPMEWKTIDKGMSRLPEACAAVIGKQNITMGAIVYQITEEPDTKKIKLTYTTDGQIPSKSPKHEVFDKVLITVPNAVLRMIERPRWSVEKEKAIRACNIQPLYKIGLQFKTRFWECNPTVEPSYGGQSTTDMPSRWIVYPSYDLKGKDMGILLAYSWSTDALSVLPASDEQRKDIALRDIQKMYPTVKIEEEFTGHYKSVHWAAEWGTGVADFLPGQFKELLPSLVCPEGNIYFAGEHTSTRHGWIVGALDSAGRACKQMFEDNVFFLPQ